MSVIDVRLQMQANGFEPVPCVGKRPSITGWQGKTSASVAEIRAWTGTNTGCLTAHTPAIDIDITDPEAAALAEEVGQELFGDRGVIPVRFGRSPKRALVLRSAAPFAKMSASYEAPNGATHKIKILADGQQLVCFGTHPDIGQPYTWCSRTPLDTPRAELAEVDEADMQAYLDLVSERLAEEYDFKRVYTNGRDDYLGAGPVDVDERLSSMRFGGAGDNSVHATQLHVTASLLRSGVGFDETVRIVSSRPPRKPSAAIVAPTVGTGVTSNWRSSACAHLSLARIRNWPASCRTSCASSSKRNTTRGARPTSSTAATGVGRSPRRRAWETGASTGYRRATTRRRGLAPSRSQATATCRSPSCAYAPSCRLIPRPCRRARGSMADTISVARSA